METNEYIERKRNEHLTDLYEFLRIPSISAQAEHKQDVERAAQWVADRLRRVGLDAVEIVQTKMHPLVYGQSLKAPGKPTVLFYGHYDVQPPEPLELWTSPAFEPAVRNGNLFGRDRKSTRLNSSHRCISYAVFCLKKKKKQQL